MYKFFKEAVIIIIYLIFELLINIKIINQLNTIVVSILNILTTIVFTYLLCTQYWKKKIQDIKKYSEIIEKNSFDYSLQSKANNGIASYIINTMVSLFNTSKESSKYSLKTSVELASATSYLTETIEALDKATEQIVATSNKIAEGSVEQVESINKIYERLELIGKKIDTIEKDSKVTVIQAENSSNAAIYGNASMDKTKDAINSIHEIVNNINDSVMSLNNQTSKISLLVDSIKNISGQTNLLALNSAIEAARAGEHGLGFAVVADEVRKLAAQSDDAAQNIDIVLTSIIDKLRELSSMMHNGTEQVTSGISTVKETSKAFIDIKTNTGETKSKIEDIYRDMIEIYRWIKDIIHEVNIVQNVSEITAASTQQYNSIVEEVKSSFNEITDKSKKLDRLANELQQEAASVSMEGYMYNKALELKQFMKTNEISNKILNDFAKRINIDDIYIVNSNGIIIYSSCGEGIGVNSFEIDPVSKSVVSSNKNYLATPIRKRVGDNILYKFLHIRDDEGGVITVAMSYESLLKL